MTLSQTDLDNIELIVKNQIKPVEKKVDSMGKDVRKINRTLKIAINLFDTDYRSIKKRVEKVEDGLGIPHPLY